MISGWVPRQKTDSADLAELRLPAGREVEGANQRLAEDVAALLEQADLKAWPYQDFSAARRADRAHLRHRATVMRLEAELRAKSEAEHAANEAEAEARQAAQTSRQHADQVRRAPARNREEDATDEHAAGQKWAADAIRLGRQAAIERLEVSRRAEAVRAAEVAESRERAEVRAARLALLQAGTGEANLLGEEQTRQSRTSSESRYWNGASELAQPDGRPDDTSADPRAMLPQRFPRRGATVWTRTSELLRVGENQTGDDLSPGADDVAPDTFSGRFTTDDDVEAVHAVEQYADLLFAKARDAETDRETNEFTSATNASLGPDATTPEATNRAMPSWIAPEPGGGGARVEQKPATDTLQTVRHRVASRWYALREVFSPTAADDKPTEPYPEQFPPVLAVFSVAGGVGKTTITATLGRALASQGERVLLADTTSRAILPVFFGGHDVKPAEVRTFSPPSLQSDQPVHVVSYSWADRWAREGTEGSWVEALKRDGRGYNRILVDLSSCASDALGELVGLGAQVLVPLTPDMNSVLSLTHLQRICSGLLHVAGNPLQPSFVLNMFEPAQPLSLDVRAILLEQLGDKLLPTVLRRSSAVGEALAEGMTVMDYAPGEGIVKEYSQLAAWLRSRAEPARHGIGQSRWSER